MDQYLAETVASGRTIRYQLLEDDKPLSFRRFIDRLGSEPSFRYFHNQLLVDSPFAVFRWETPAITQKNIDRDYQFILHDSPALARPATPTAFREHFSSQRKVIAFPNLGRNAQMIVPCPTGDDTHYTHLGSFVRNAPPEQIDELWEVVGKEMAAAVGSEPVWLSTAGGGVAWLHVRIDTAPKYYTYRPYKEMGTNH